MQELLENRVNRSRGYCRRSSVEYELVRGGIALRTSIIKVVALVEIPAQLMEPNTQKAEEKFKTCSNLAGTLCRGSATLDVT